MDNDQPVVAIPVTPKPPKTNYHGPTIAPPGTDVPAKDIKKVISGGIVQKKKSLAKKFGETFLGGSMNAAWHYMFFDILIPSMQKLFLDVLNGGSERLVYGEKINPNIRRDQGRSYVSYNNYSQPGIVPIRRADIAMNRDRHNFSVNILESKNDAEDVLSQLVGLIQQYGMASVSDMNSLLGLPGEFTDQNWGWTTQYNLSTAYISRVREGYLIELPRPIPLG